MAVPKQWRFAWTADQNPHGSFVAAVAAVLRRWVGSSLSLSLFVQRARWFSARTHSPSARWHSARPSPFDVATPRVAERERDRVFPSGARQKRRNPYRAQGRKVVTGLSRSRNEKGTRPHREQATKR